MNASEAARAVIAHRRRERQACLEEARAFVDALDPALGVRGAVVVGSVARGDFHEESDIDVLIVAERLPARYPERLRAVGWPAGGRVEPVVWTPEELRRQLARGELVSTEAVSSGVWLVGGAELARADDRGGSGQRAS